MKKFKGEIEGFPEEIVEKMMYYQEQQGNVRSSSIFETNKYAGIMIGGFDWCHTPEGHEFWNEVVSKCLFEIFFIRYPKIPAYPKVMWVKDDCDGNWRKRVVFAYKKGKYISWVNAETLEDAEKETECISWNCAKDIEPEPQIPEYTMEQLFKELGEKFIIKKS